MPRCGRSQERSKDQVCSIVLMWISQKPSPSSSRGFCQNSCQTRRREVKAEFSLRCFENSEHTAGTTQVKQATAAGGDVLIVVGARAEEVAELVIASTEALRGCEALEPAHTSRAPFHAPVVLLEPIVLVDAGPVLDIAAERAADRPRVGAVAIRGDALRSDTNAPNS